MVQRLFACGICGSIYRTELFAQACETRNPPAPAKYAVGDRIRFATYKGDDSEVDVVQEVKLVANHFICPMKGWEPQGEKGLEEFFGRIDDNPLHDWAYRVSEEYGFGDDPVIYTDWIREDLITKKILQPPTTAIAL